MKNIKIKQIILNSDFKPSIGNKNLNFYLNNFSYYHLRDFDFNIKTKILVDGQFFVSLINILLNKSIKRNSFDFTSNAAEIFNFISKNNKKLFVIGSTEENSDIFKTFLLKKYNINNCTSINGFVKNINQFLLTKNIHDSFVIIGTGSPFQENLANFVYENFINTEVYTCGGFITQTAESIISNNNHNYYPVFFAKYNLRWLYRLLNTKYVFKRIILYYPISTIYFFYNFIISKK